MEEQIAAVRRMQSYIETHLDEEITLSGLARASCYSPWHSHRLFVRWLDMTPADYIRRLRLSKSALLLREEVTKIIDVAFRVGFNSVDGYQRAFFREFQCNPKEYAKNPVPIFLFNPYKVESSKKEKEKLSMETIKTVLVQVTKKPARKVLIKRGMKADEYFSYCAEVGCDVWGLLLSVKSPAGEPVCLWLPKKYIRPNTSEYVQGAEVPLDYSGVVPEGFDVIELPACKYLMFQSEPFEEENYREAIGQVQKVVENYDPSLLGYEWDKENPRIQLEPKGERGNIELLPIK